MFKRLFIISGVISFILAVSTMWFWYLPMKEKQRVELEKMDQSQFSDSTGVFVPDSVVE